MKRFIAVLSGILVLPAFAEVAPVYYDEIVEYTDDMVNDADDANLTEESGAAQSQNTNSRTIINRSTSVSRAISGGNSGTTTRKNVSSRAVASSPRATTGTTRATTARATRTGNVVNRSSTNTKPSVTARGTQNARVTKARVGTSNNSVMPANRISNRDGAATLTDSGKALYNANGARASVTGRRATARLSSIAVPRTATVVTAEDVTETTNNLNALAELTDYCKAQYAACMDNYCDVLDDNQGRCSCSKNIKNYAKTEAALEQATTEFQAAIQKIRYIGLTGAQVESLFTETEAELTMKSASDSSKLKNSLDAIKKKIVDVSTPTSSGFESTSGIAFDLNGLLDTDFTAGFDLNAFLGNTGTTSSNVSNQRGETLYKTATNRCKSAVLNSCTAQGVDANVITNAYDLEIDKQCVAYERSLNEANREMKDNLTNATNILQQARLMLQQNKNSYDFRNCIAAIDSCMQDDYVCGSDYELCLDPTGKYLANGEIVKGGTPGVSGGQAKSDPINYGGNNNDEVLMDKYCSGGMYNLYSLWNYKGTCSENGNTTKDTLNAWSMGSQENLGGYIDAALDKWKTNYTKSNLQTDNLALYLLQKIGYIDSDDKVHGMCASAMKQCQDYTFNTKRNNKSYIPDNEVVRQYLNSTLAKIKAQQDAILSDYAEGCRSDVQSCLSTNGYDESAPSVTASKSAVNACASEIATCMSVGGYQVDNTAKLTLRAMTDWVASIYLSCGMNQYLSDNGKGITSEDANNTQRNAAKCVSCPYPTIVNTNGQPYTSDYIFSEGLARPDSTDPTQYVTNEQSTSSGGQVRVCDCPSGFKNYIKMDDDQVPTLYCVPVEEPTTRS